MKKFFLLVGFLGYQLCHAAEPTVTVPWTSFDHLYRGQIEQQLKVIEKPSIPVINLEQVLYDLTVQGQYVTGTVSMAGNVQAGDPNILRLFGQKIAVTEILETQNAVLIASNGGYWLDTQESGAFLIVFKASIPILDYQINPRLEFAIPVAVRNELVIDSPQYLRLIENNKLHKIEGSYFFPPTGQLNIGFEHVNQQIEGVGSDTANLMAQVDTPDVVLDTVSFFISFTEDGSVMSAISLLMPANAENQLELNPIENAEVWSLNVNGIARSLYNSPEQKWIIPLEPNVDSNITLAYLTRGPKLGLEGRLDFKLPATGLTARRVDLAVGLPQRMEMLAMDSNLQPAHGAKKPLFKSFNGRPHYFSKPFYRGHELTSSIIYQEPLNAVGSKL